MSEIENMSLEVKHDSGEPNGDCGKITQRKRKRRRMDDFFTEQEIPLKDECLESTSTSRNSSRRRSSLSQRGARLASLTKMGAHKSTKRNSPFEEIALRVR
jgi:hypothetical protein